MRTYALTTFYSRIVLSHVDIRPNDNQLNKQLKTEKKKVTNNSSVINADEINEIHTQTWKLQYAF